MMISICICTLNDREHLLQRLLDVLAPQLTPDVEVLIERDDGESPIGVKRQRLLDRATGYYHACLDDDDLVSPNYIERLVTASRDRSDAIMFDINCYRDGLLSGVMHPSMSHSPCGDRMVDDVRHLDCPPKHLCAVRTTIARRVGFQPINLGEDTAFEQGILPFIRHETRINEVLYEYLWVSPVNREEHSNRFGGLLPSEASAILEAMSVPPSFLTSSDTNEGV